MADFTLDTSGFVALRFGETGGQDIDLFWADLDAFTQGYVERVCRAAEDTLGGFTITGIRFSDLSSEALAMILADCAAFKRQYVLPWYDGAEFWSGRQSGEYAPYFPPLSVFLGDDGKVHLREAAR